MKPLRARPMLVVPGRALPKVAIGYAFGTLHWPFVRSLRDLGEHRFQLMAAGHTPIVRYEIPQQGLYIDENRNRMVQQFMKTDAEWLLQIDTDIEFPPDLPETMVALAGHSKKILAASVPLTPPIPGCAMRYRDMPGTYNYVPEDEITEDGIEVDCVASAVLLVHRDVFTAIADQIGECWFLKAGPGSTLPDFREESSVAAWQPDGKPRDRKYIHIGEDVLFCLRANDAGYKPWCAKVPGLRHYKTIPLTHDGAEESVAPVEPQAEKQEAAQEATR